MRSTQLNVTGQPQDVYVTSPWRAPGTAPVYASGCGAAGGGPTAYANGGQPPPGVPQGADGVLLPAHGEAERWERGTDVEVAWAISANHGGGYSYRLCPSDNLAGVNESCFQANPLEFAGQLQWAAYPNGSRVEMPLRMTTNGTFPKGSQWARDPIPECYVCDAYTTCGAPLKPIPSDPEPEQQQQLQQVETTSAADDAAPDGEGAGCSAIAKDKCSLTNKPGDWNCLECGDANDCTTCCPGTKLTKRNIKGREIAYCAAPGGPPKPGNKWEQQVECYGACGGSVASKVGGVCPGETAFPEGAPGFSGFGKITFPWSIVDKVKVPATLPAGNYLLSWRWDCEESTQVWQNCVDVVLV
jgi:hypothetical protein